MTKESQRKVSFTQKKRLRKNYGKIKNAGTIPNLLELQKSSYKSFLSINKDQEKAELQKTIGIEDAFRTVFPIKDFSGRTELHFIKCGLEDPKYDVDECNHRGLTYSAPLRVTLSLIIKEMDAQTGVTRVDSIKEQDVYFGDMPLMTKQGTFVINGTERVIVSQMQRSPGVFFDNDKGKALGANRSLYSARVIPYRGSWIDIEFDPKDNLFVRIDRKRKLPVTSLLMALDNDESEEYRKTAAEAGEEELDYTKIHGLSKEEILNTFYKTTKISYVNNSWQQELTSDIFKRGRLKYDLLTAKGKFLVKSGERLTRVMIKQFIDEGITNLLVGEEELVGQFFAKDYINSEGLVLINAGDEIELESLEILLANDILTFETLNIDGQTVGIHMRNTLALEKNISRDQALIDIYKVIRPGEPPTRESAEATFRSLFFDGDKFNLSAVGRMKLNERLKFTNVDDDCRTLRKQDIIEIIRELIRLKDSKGKVDDIDHLGNRRVRSVGELLENRYQLGLIRIERTIKDRMSSLDVEKIMPQDLINAKPVASVIKEFFSTSQLSQFMDQTNPLSEITHKRRLSALGPGGLTRDRAGFEVRDVHPTHYGRICPVETPEGPNIGLINSLATYARVNPYGFIETPYCRVKDGYVLDQIEYLSASNESGYIIAQANTIYDPKSGKILDKRVSCRRSGDYYMASPEEINYIDVSPKQLVSVAASLIPFLENDDANRALMGANMQRQSVPLLKAEAPLVGTGMEAVVARDSGVSVLALRDGIVDQVDAKRIVIKVDEEKDFDQSRVDIYTMSKFQKSNQNTCINQKPLVDVGDRVYAGDIIADGPATDLGELALGRNVLVAFMPWSGYNFEDSILISERMAQDDVFTSIHIEEYECLARDSKLGNEEITRDIPNVSSEALRNLDETGIVYIGSEVQAGDVLVGKVTPKGESPITPEEKLLRAIFGDKAADVLDTSLKVPPGGQGTVVEVKVFTRHGVEKSERALSIGRTEIEALAIDQDAERKILASSYTERLSSKLLNQSIEAGPKQFSKGQVIDEQLIKDNSYQTLRQITTTDENLNNELSKLSDIFDKQIEFIKLKFEDKVDKLQKGDELLPGVMKLVKVFVAVKRKIQAGDKMAGRHGNKGVVSKILAVEDMPFLEDGTHVDIVLNPLGVPSRMNVGQILETHLGWSCVHFGKQINEMLKKYKRKHIESSQFKEFISQYYDKEEEKDLISSVSDSELLALSQNLVNGIPIATPVFDGAKESDINQALTKADLPTSGQVSLFDGRTGDKFDRDVTVGYIYMLKLHHLVDDKLHARSTGPYSLVTQQPLGGKAQFGGQRFGEMEVWALQAYGAAYTLQEILTVKSDDISGRTKVYESIIRGDDNFETGTPESFNVLVKELRSLCLNVELLQMDNN